VGFEHLVAGVVTDDSEVVLADAIDRRAEKDVLDRVLNQARKGDRPSRYRVGRMTRAKPLKMSRSSPPLPTNPRATGPLETAPT
jgi:hypothetical protein